MRFNSNVVDNWTEFKRSQECPQFLARTYESNGLISIQELVSPMSKLQFYQNEEPIIEILSQLATAYLFNDIGYTNKNYCNWGYRLAESTENQKDDDAKEICCLDYGYMYPLIGQPKDLFICPKCGSPLAWNRTYTHFQCTMANCRLEYSATDMWRKMDKTILNKEDEMLHRAISGTQADFVEIEKILGDLYDMID